MADEQDTKKSTKRVRSRVGFWRWVWRISAGTFAVVVVLLALFIGLFRVAVPLLPDFQQRIETAATDALGFPTTVGTIDARWRLRGPELVFENVLVRAPGEERTLLRANRLRVAIDALALVREGSIRTTSITVTGSELTLRRDAEGAWHVQDIPIASLRSERPSESPWGISDGAFGVQNLMLTVIDEVVGHSFSVPDVDVDVVVEDQLLGVSGEFELMRRGPRIEFSLDADGRADNIDSVVWTGFLSGNAINWARVEALLPSQPAWTTREPVDLSVWLRATGFGLSEANVAIDAEEVEITGTGQSVARVAGQFSWTGESESWALNGENVDISSGNDSTSGTVRFERSSPDAQPVPGGTPGAELPGAERDVSTESAALTPNAVDDSVALENDAGAPARADEQAPAAGDASQLVNARYAFAATELNLDELAVLAAPLSDQVAKWVNDLAPSGRIRDLEGFADIRENTLADFELLAKLDSVGIKGAKGRPGFSMLDAHIYGGRESGGVELMRVGQVSIPGVLRETLELRTAKARVNWEDRDGALRIDVGALELETSDIQVAGQVVIERPTPADSLAGDISLTVGRLDLARAYRYFPVNRFSERLLKWLDGALTAGTGSDGTFRLRGPLNKFPYPNPDDGEFVATIKLNDATLNYANNWPPATELDAQLTFERNGMRAVVSDARMLTLPVQSAQATIDDFKSAVVFVEGAITAQLDDMRAYLDATPLVANWGSGWSDAQFYGDGSAQLSLTLPTKERQNIQYDVSLQIDDGSFQFRDWRQTVTALQGELKATRAGLWASGVRGSFLGEPVEISLAPSTTVGYSTDISLKGTARPSSLSRYVNEGLADLLSGTADWSAEVTLPKPGENALLQARLRSPLQGMAITLPAPLAKSAGDVRFADATLTVIDEGRLNLTADYGDATNIIARVRRADDGFWSVPRGELRFGGGTATLPESDIVRVMGSVPVLDMSAILEFGQRYSSERPWLDFGTAELAVSELRGFGQEFGATTVNMVHDAQGRELTFLGERLSGELTVPAVITPESPIVGQFETLRWSSTEGGRDIDPREAPSLRAVVDNFRFNDYELGTLVAHLEARENLVAVREFTTTAPDFNTRTTGSWVFGDESSTTYLVSELKSSNVQNTLRALGLAEFMEASEASARFEMSWPDGWTSDYLATMDGELSVEVGQGKLRSVDPGAGRVFGLLSIGALPRRLNLDFRDVFDSGFGFDSITGDFVIRGGDAVTDNLALSGPAANVVMIGRTGLIDKDYDQTAVVYANFGSSLPIAGALAGGPAVGAALLVVTEIFKKPLQSMGKVSYSITGSWDDPVVARTGAAAPATATDESSPESGGGQDSSGAPENPESTEPANGVGEPGDTAAEDASTPASDGIEPATPSDESESAE